MLSKKIILMYVIAIIFVAMVFVSCGKEPEFDGDALVNYPDMEMIMKQYIAPFEKDPYTFKLTTIENGKKDSTFLKASNVQWDKIKAPFLQANLYQKKLDKKYNIELLNDTVTRKMTMLLTALDNKAITTKMSIVGNASDNKIATLYAETRDAGFFTTTEYKLLLVSGKTIQIQESKKSPFSSVKRKIQTLSFLN